MRHAVLQRDATGLPPGKPVTARWASFGFASRRSLLPLPAGEGWGEGENSVLLRSSNSSRGFTLTLTLSLKGE
ncbi:MAG: hypothetical protein RMK20_09085, partial [Verrucomicrobiales bacterium]|nr:hypothetical protein [Verrucomicrobiales bacterium]